MDALVQLAGPAAATPAALAAAAAALAAALCAGCALAERRWLGASERVVVFSRYPVAGTTKTRLVPAVGEDGAAFLQRRMTEELLSQLQTWSRATGAALVEMRHYGGSRADMQGWLGRRFRGADALFMRAQLATGGLGNKIAEAFDSAFREGAQRVCVVGCDIPALSHEEIEAAFAALSGGADMVLGPALDGGYYLVALSRATAGGAMDRDRLEALFDGEKIAWGTETVRVQQLEVAAALGLRSTVLERKLSDVDELEDLPAAEEALGLGQRQLTRPAVSVVIPTLNEGSSIEACVRTLVDRAARCDKGQGEPALLHLSQIVISDGGSKDDTVRIARGLVQAEWWPKRADGETVKLLVVEGEAGRGAQLSRGTAAATSEVLLFLHADTVPPKLFDATAVQTLLPPGVAAGAFRFALDVCEAEPPSWWARCQLAALEWGTNVRATARELPYGDQGLFVLRSTLDRVGGWRADFPLLEDLELVQRLSSTEGRVVIAPGEPALTSARRWLKHGICYVTAFNQLVLLRYACGSTPEELARWYYGR